MINLIQIVISAIFEILPDSPFRAMFDELMIEFDFLPFLNWFLPFDICANMMLAWLDCILIYYFFVMVKKIVWDLIMSKLVTLGGVTSITKV